MLATGGKIRFDVEDPFPFGVAGPSFVTFFFPTFPSSIPLSDLVVFWLPFFDPLFDFPISGDSDLPGFDEKDCSNGLGSK